MIMICFDLDSLIIIIISLVKEKNTLISKMVDKKIIRIVFGVICCPCWWQYYSWLHNSVKTCDICLDVFNSIGNTLWKILFVLFMWFCGFGIISCVMCIFSLIDVWKSPCKVHIPLNLCVI